MICVLPHCGYLSETSRMLLIYEALKSRGVPVRLATHGGTYESLLARSGDGFDQIPPRVSAERCAELVGLGLGLGPPDQSAWTDTEIRDHALAEAAYFREHDVSVVVTGFALTALLSTRLAGAVLVTEHAGSYVPIVAERGLMPLPRPEDVPEPLRGLPETVVREQLRQRFGQHDSYCSAFNSVAAELGVEPVPSMAALILGDLTLITETPEVLGISEADVESWRPVGGGRYRPSTRLAYAGPIHAHLDVPVPDRAAALLADPRPTVYVAMTSTRAELVRAVVERVVASGPWTVLVAGTVHDLGDLEAIDPDRVVVEGLLPSHLIMPAAAAAVVTGGQGSVQAALSGGTPLVGIPLHPEQDLNVDIAVRLGAAVAVPPSRVGTVDLTQAVQAVCGEPRFAAAAAWIQRQYAAVDGPARAAEHIERLHSANPGPTSRSQNTSSQPAISMT